MSGPPGVYGRKGPAPGLRFRASAWGLWSAVMTRGRLLTWQSARLSSRYQLSERPILVPRNREVLTCSGRDAFSRGKACHTCGCKGAELCARFGASCTPLPLRSEVVLTRMGAWRRKVSAARGLWSSPDGPGIACIPSTPSCYIGVSERKQCGWL